MLAVRSLVLENPTVDEVAHMPAGITYWQTGSFRLYPHNPPLVKLAAALPVVLARPDMDLIYRLPSWRGEPPVHASIAHEFAVVNAARYFELFTMARLVIPVFSVLGGLVVFLWSRRLYGPWGGLLSLTLWAFCPNLLAHARLVTTDAGATALGVLATYLFWQYLHRPGWKRAALAGAALGLATLAKFSMLLLFGLWPVLWLAAEVARSGLGGLAKGVSRAVGHGLLVVLVSLFVINVGYGFEGTFRPLGSFEFASEPLCHPRPAGKPAPVRGDSLLNLAWQHRENRFRGTWLEALPVPLPRYFLTGFDRQKLDAEGIPLQWVDPNAKPGQKAGYPVYLDGVLREHGWWYYYLKALAYKVPEGTIVLALLSVVVLLSSPRARAPWADELAVGIVPVVTVLAMSLGTDINLGLRYILPILPYLYIAAGKLAPWALGTAAIGRNAGTIESLALTREGRAATGPKPHPAATGVISLCLAATALACLFIHPHYLAYFNWASGGPDSGSEHLIDSNLDWGQDLVNLRDWLRTNAPGERVGLAYFGQINPNILQLREEGFDWFLATPLPGTIKKMNPLWPVDGFPERLQPGLYAISASFVRGLPYAVYDSSMQVPFLYPSWDTRNVGPIDRKAFGYFQELTPIAHVGHSIFIYRLTPDDAARINAKYGFPPPKTP